jgi:hypothetical protein
MNKRMLVFLDLLDLVERMHFEEISYDFLKIIMRNEIKKGGFPKNFEKYLRIKNYHKKRLL